MAPEEEKVTTIRLRKLVLRSVSLVGIESGCSRVNTGPLPVEVPVLSALQHGFRIRAPATEGDFSASIVLSIDSGAVERITIRFSGNVAMGQDQIPKSPVPDPAFLNLSLFRF